MDNTNIWYDYAPVLSYGKAMFIFIIGERGVGKTYGAKKWCINKFIKKNEQFIYLRRYKTELKESAGTTDKFFKAIYPEFPGHKFQISGSNILCDGKTMGYTIALSTANILKSTSFDGVTTIIFDEFIIDKGCYHYLQNEVEQLLELFETIARLRNIRIIFLGNAVSITNPYFIYFNLTLPYGKDIKTFKDGLIVVNYIKNEKYRKVKHESNFGKLIAGTNYSKYAIDNEFLRDSKAFIGKKTASSTPFFTLVYKNHTFGFWIDNKTSHIYVSKDYDPTNPTKFTVNTDDHSEQTLLLSLRSSFYFKAVISHFRMGILFFENQQIKGLVMQIIEKHLTY